MIQGEEYKVNLDSIFKEEKENTYSFISENKGFTLDTSSLKLISDQGAYSISNNYSNNQRAHKDIKVKIVNQSWWLLRIRIIWNSRLIWFGTQNLLQ